MSTLTPDPIASAPVPQTEITRIGQLSSEQWRSGIAAWLGWLFDGLDMHLYTLVAAPFVTELLGLAPESKDDAIGWYSSLIQASFLFGWAIGGGIFGRIGDRLGRTRALSLTILTYALFTGLSFFAQTWWQLMIFRFLAALGIGGEWAVGASLLSETWPRRWRPWIAAVLQTGVNIGVLLASISIVFMSGLPHRCVFLLGVVPAFMVLWIRKSVPEPAEWHAAKAQQTEAQPGIGDLFRGDVRRTTLLTIAVCATSLTGHWAFMFWFPQHLRNLPDIADWTDAEKTRLAGSAMTQVMICSVLGNFLAATLARFQGYRRAIVTMCLAYFLSMLFTYGVVRDHQSMLFCLTLMGFSQGVFALFTMYMPPLFPTLLRTTGAGFCYNIGRIAAAAGTIGFGLFSKVGDYRTALLYSGFLFLPAALVALFLSEPPHEATPAALD